MGKKSYSAAVLDEAHRVRTQMDWVLFTHEQERLLFGESEVEWTPGDPLYTPPPTKEEFLAEVLSDVWSHRGHQSDDVRDCPIVACRRSVRRATEMVEEHFAEYDSLYQEQMVPRCRNCEVGWRGEPKSRCFICGEQPDYQDEVKFIIDYWCPTNTSADWSPALLEMAERHDERLHQDLVRILSDTDGGVWHTPMLMVPMMPEIEDRTRSIIDSYDPPTGVPNELRNQTDAST